MLTITGTEWAGFEAAIRGARNPLNSWNKSDSVPGYGDNGCDLIIGKNDIDLLLRLRNAGTDHRKFMRMICVWCDVTAPLYWWKEFDTYKIGTVANSCSTMHKIHSKELTLDDFSCEHLIKDGVELLKAIIEAINSAVEIYGDFDELYAADALDQDLTCKKDVWWQMIQLLPSAYNQKRTVMLNYEVLSNIYHSRKNHKLDCWHTFCDWIETLPYSELITGKGCEANE